MLRLLLQVTAAEKEKKRQEQEAAMAAAVEQAKAEAEAKLAAEMAAAEKAAEESAERDRAKFQRDLSRPGGLSAVVDIASVGGYEPATVEAGGRRKSTSGDAQAARTSRRMSNGGNVYKHNYVANSEEFGEDALPSLVKASSARVIKEELFDVTITREVQGGTLGIAVDLWDGEVSTFNCGIRTPIWTKAI